MSEPFQITRRDALRIGLAGAVAALTNRPPPKRRRPASSSSIATEPAAPAPAIPACPMFSSPTAARSRRPTWTGAAPAGSGPGEFFVIKPAGYMPPVDPLTGSPRFYHLHSPKGSPAALELTFPVSRRPARSPPRSISP